MINKFKHYYTNLINMKSIKIMVSGFVIIIIGFVLKSYSLVSNIITTILFALGFIIFAWGGFLTTLDAVFECFEQNNEEELT